MYQHSQQDSSLALQMVHLAVEVLIEREVGALELDEEIPDAGCPMV
jgi:hypothetical protein